MSIHMSIYLGKYSANCLLWLFAGWQGYGKSPPFHILTSVSNFSAPIINSLKLGHDS